MAQVALQGHCRCGKAAFELSKVPTNTTNCHCQQCRHYSSAAFTTFSDVEPSDCHWISKDTVIERSDSPAAKRLFCKECFTQLFMLYSGAKEWFVCTGCLDESTMKTQGFALDALIPNKHIFVNDKAPWYEIKDGLKQCPQGPE